MDLLILKPWLFNHQFHAAINQLPKGTFILGVLSEAFSHFWWQKADECGAFGKLVCLFYLYSNKHEVLAMKEPLFIMMGVTSFRCAHWHSKKQTRQAGSLLTVDIQTHFLLIFVLLDLEVALIQSPHCADCWYSDQFSSYLCPLRLGGCTNSVSSLRWLAFNSSECSY